MLKSMPYRKPPTIVKIIVALLAFGFFNQLAVMVYGMLSLPPESADFPALQVIMIITPIFLLLIYSVLLYTLWIGHKFGFIGVVILAALTILRLGPILFNSPPMAIVTHFICLIVATLLLCKKEAREYFGFK